MYVASETLPLLRCVITAIIPDVQSAWITTRTTDSSCHRERAHHLRGSLGATWQAVPFRCFVTHVRLAGSAVGSLLSWQACAFATVVA
jgi:hypothetical protein